MPAQHTRSTGLLCGRSVALELSTRQLERSGSWQGQLQAFAEDASIFTVLIEAFSVLEMFRTIRSTNLLTYFASVYRRSSARMRHWPSENCSFSEIYCTMSLRVRAFMAVFFLLTSCSKLLIRRTQSTCVLVISKKREGKQ